MPASTVPYELPDLSTPQRHAQIDEFIARMSGRRSCRHFSGQPVPAELVEKLVAAANLAPSGANRQPWRFVAVDDPDIKRRIRLAAEAEERDNYGRRFPPEWLEALEPLGTNAEKPFLEIAPWLVVVFRVDWEWQDGGQRKNYYVPESVGLACGFFLVACHLAGLATLTHTPNPMNFLRDILGRPKNEKAFLLIPVGQPAPGARVPDLRKKTVHQVLQWNLGTGPRRP